MLIVSGLILSTVFMGFGGGAGATGVDVSGRVRVPELCSPAVSPAVVRLEPVDPVALPEAPDAAEIGFIDQRGLRFEPRVVALRKGQTLRFGNADTELHNVHLRGEGVTFNQGVPPGGTVDFVPEHGGVIKVLCDVHNHMRAFLVVGESPWAAACGRTGAFRFRNVPAGRYRLHVWQEMGAPVVRDLTVGREAVDMGTIAVQEGPNPATADDREQVCETGCEPWPLVIDRVAMTLAASLDAAQRPDTLARAVPLAQDAFYRDFEASGMETAVRVHLGQARAAELEELLGAVTSVTRDVVGREAGPSRVIGPTRQALLRLAKASEELNRKGVTERSKIFATTSPAFWVEDTPATASDAVPIDGFAGGAAASLRLTVRDGAVVLVLLTFLCTLAATFDPSRGGLSSVKVPGLALAASLLTAACVALAAGTQTMLLIAGLVALAASVAFFSVGNRLGALFDPASGGQRTFGLLAFLAFFPVATEVVRALEALTRLPRTGRGTAGLATGLVVGLLLLAGLFIAARRALAGLRRPIGPWVLSAFSFGVAIVAAGHGVFALQSAHVLKATGLEGLGGDLPLLGLHPNLQALTVQALLLAGASTSLATSGRANPSRRDETAEVGPLALPQGTEV